MNPILTSAPEKPVLVSKSEIAEKLGCGSTTLRCILREMRANTGFDTGRRKLLARWEADQILAFAQSQFNNVKTSFYYSAA